MQIDPAVLMARPNRRRTEPNVPWSLARQSVPWTDEERALLARRWHNETMTIEQIAALHERTTHSCRNQACKHRFGTRPKEQSFGRGVIGRPKKDKPFRRKEPIEKPVEPAPLLDGVVMTPRLEAAWARVEAGEDVATVAAELRCPTVEVLALRRWKAAA